jgi:hypothetical protein
MKKVKLGFKYERKRIKKEIVDEHARMPACLPAGRRTLNVI